MIPLYVGNHTFHVDFTIKPRINNYETVKEFVTGPQPIIKLDSLVAHNEGINIIGTNWLNLVYLQQKKSLCGAITNTFFLRHFLANYLNQNEYTPKTGNWGKGKLLPRCVSRVQGQVSHDIFDCGSSAGSHWKRKCYFYLDPINLLLYFEMKC